MNGKLRDLYEFPDGMDPALMELTEYCAVLEERVLQLAQSLSEEDRAFLEAWIDVRDELEFQTVKKALRIGSRLGKGYGSIMD